MNQTTHKRSWLDTLWGRMTAVSQLPLLTAGEQTKLTWARAVETLEDAPPPYAPGLAALAAELGYFPRCILTPSYAGFLTRTTEKLVCCWDDRVRIWERAGGEVRSVTYALDAIEWMESGSVLLKAWLKIAGTDETGRRAATTIRFNAVTDYLFLPILHQWRSRGQEGVTTPLAAEQARFNSLGQDHYKFMNIARRVLFPGDGVRAYVMQPEMRAPVAHLFGRTWSRLTAPAHIVVLTNRELIVAAEESNRPWRDDTHYGSISTYIPLDRIAGVSAEHSPDGELHVTVDLPGEEQVALDFAVAHAAEAERLLALLPVSMKV